MSRSIKNRLPWRDDTLAAPTGNHWNGIIFGSRHKICLDFPSNITTTMAAKKTSKISDDNTPPKSTAAKTPVKKAKKTAAATTQKVVKDKTAKPTPKLAVAKLSPDEVARAAYLNYRRRVEQGLPGDSRGDWLEAEKALGKAKGA